MKVEEIVEYFKPSLYEMSNFQHHTTGLPSGTRLWISAEPEVLPHVRYRINIDHPQRGSAVFAIWGDDAEQVEGDWKVSGRDLRKIKTLVTLAKDSLRKHIDGLGDSADLASVLLKIKPEVEKA